MIKQWLDWSKQVQNILERECRWFQLFSIDFSYFIF